MYMRSLAIFQCNSCQNIYICPREMAVFAIIFFLVTATIVGCACHPFHLPACVAVCTRQCLSLCVCVCVCPLSPSLNPSSFPYYPHPPSDRSDAKNEEFWDKPLHEYISKTMLQSDKEVRVCRLSLCATCVYVCVCVCARV